MERVVAREEVVVAVELAQRVRVAHHETKLAVLGRPYRGLRGEHQRFIAVALLDAAAETVGAFGVVPARLHDDAAALGADAGAARRVNRAERAVLCATENARSLGRLSRGDGNDPADGFGTPERGLRASQHLGAGDAVGPERFPAELA